MSSHHSNAFMVVWSLAIPYSFHPTYNKHLSVPGFLTETQQKLSPTAVGPVPVFPGTEWYKHVYKSITPVLLQELCAAHCGLHLTEDPICQYSALVNETCYLGSFEFDPPIIGPQVENVTVNFLYKGWFKNSGSLIQLRINKCSLVFKATSLLRLPEQNTWTKIFIFYVVYCIFQTFFCAPSMQPT